MKKNRVFSVQEFESMIDNSSDVKGVSSVVIVAMGQYAQKKLSMYAFAGVLSKASNKIYSFK